LYFGKIAIRKRTLVSSSMGTSTGIALPRTSIGNLRVWVPTYTTYCNRLSARYSYVACGIRMTRLIV
jgi:hypothetical protein